jgi:hypothetical protein
MENKALKYELKRIKLFMEGTDNEPQPSSDNIEKIISKELYNIELMKKKTIMVSIYMIYN